MVKLESKLNTMYKLSKYPKIETTKTSKNLSENLRIDLNFYERQKDCTKSNKKKKLSRSFTCFILNFELTKKRNSLKNFGYSVIFDTYIVSNITE